MGKRGRGQPGRGRMGAGTGPLRRGGRRGGGAVALSTAAQERLAEASALAAAGDHSAAAEAFARLAQVARDKARPEMAAHFGARAAANSARGGDTDALRAHTQAAVTDAKVQGDKDRSARLFGQLVSAVRDSAAAEIADELEAQLRAQLGVAPRKQEGEAPVVNRAMRRQLPAACSACGTGVQADLVVFHSEAGADCADCGSPLGR